MLAFLTPSYALRPTHAGGAACRARACAPRRLQVTAQLQAEPQPGEPGYRPNVAGGRSGKGKGEGAAPKSGSSEAVPEAAKQAIRAPMAAVGRPKITPKTKSYEMEEAQVPKVSSFAEARAKMSSAGTGSSAVSTASPKATPMSRARRSTVDSGLVPKFPGLPDYLQPLPEDTREQREKLRMRIPTGRK